MFCYEPQQTTHKTVSATDDRIVSLSRNVYGRPLVGHPAEYLHRVCDGLETTVTLMIRASSHVGH